MRTFFLILSLVLAGTSAVRGQDAPSRAAIQQAARDLGDASFQTRKRARELLVGVGWEAKAELEQAAKSADPEVGDVARQLLAEMLPGVTRDTPADQRKLVARYTKTKSSNTRKACVQELAKLHPFPDQLLLALLEAETERGRQAAVVGWLVSSSSQWLPRMLFHRDAAPYEAVIRRAVRMETLAAIPQISGYALQRGKLKAMREQLMKVVAAKPTPFLRRLLVELHLLGGHRAEAVVTARELDSWPLLEQVLVRACAWEELAKALLEKTGDMNGLRRFQLAAAQRLAGQDKLATGTLAPLAGEDGAVTDDVPIQLNMGGGGPWINNQFNGVAWQGWGGRMGMQQQFVANPGMFGHMGGMSRRRGSQKVPAWRCLLAYGLTADAVRALEEAKGTKTAIADILLLQNRYAEADRLLRQELADAKPPRSWLLAVRRSGLLRALGDDTAVGASKEMLEHLRSGEQDVKSIGGMHTIVKAIEDAGYGELLADALPELMVRFEGTEENNARRVVLYLAPAACRVLASSWWTTLSKADPESSLVSRAVRLRDFLHGRLSPEETQKVLRMALRPEAPVKERVGGLAMVARTCARMGRQAEAEAAYRLAARFATEEEDTGLQRSVWHASFDVFSAARKWQELAEAQAGLAEQGGLDRMALLATFLAWSGERQSAEKMMEKALLATDAGTFRKVLPHLLNGEWKDAVRRVLPLVEADSARPSPEAMEGARLVGDYALELRLAQRGWYRWVCAPQSATPEQLLTANANLASAECRAMIAGGKLDEVLARATQVSDAFPKDIDGAADTVEALDRAGAQAQADALVAHVLKREQEFLDKLPNAVQHLNAIAWLCARTGRELNRGVNCILKAIEREPNRAEFIDTLAVLLHRKGDRAGAIEATRRCLRIDFADNEYLHQLGRWLSEQKQQ